MTKKADRTQKRLRPLTDQDLRAVSGGGPFNHGKPGEFSSSSGGGGGSL